ncbi:putative deoxyribonuclease V [Rosa chinensis]|uniref:Putative deoxyribonuclease V n=1 Tax=Rosa chinensis TaxID=74649 RepID=A0A2P6Q1N8_ROSCH|nr:putative deoxyribonuclease V [Rosa chinensis]
MACGTLVVLDIHTLQVVYEDYSVLTLSVPYVPGFLAFREAPVLLELLEKMKAGANLSYPLLHHVDGLTLSGVRQLLKAKKDCAEDFITLTGCSGRIWGVAMRSTDGCLKPIFISIGDRISLDTAIKIVKMTCKYRVPESIRQADIRSREYLRKHQGKIYK